jgi:hypothetical protein
VSNRTSRAGAHRWSKPPLSDMLYLVHAAFLAQTQIPRCHKVSG